MLTRKHFEMIARNVKSVRDHSRSDTFATHCVDRLARNLADEFANENERFNRERFLDACGVES